MTKLSAEEAIYASAKHKRLAVEVIAEIQSREDIPLSLRQHVISSTLLNCVSVENAARQRLRELALDYQLDTIEAL